MIDGPASSRGTERLTPSKENIEELRKTVKNAQALSKIEEQRLCQLVANEIALDLLLI